MGRSPLSTVKPHLHLDFLHIRLGSLQMRHAWPGIERGGRGRVSRPYLLDQLLNQRGWQGRLLVARLCYPRRRARPWLQRAQAAPAYVCTAADGLVHQSDNVLLKARRHHL